MRFMLLLKGDAVGESPGQELVDAMIKYNEDLVKAGILLAAEGLLDSSTGSRVVYSRGKKTVIDGPFTEAKELIAGFLLIQVRSKEEAIEWAKRCPVEKALGDDDDREAVVEVRQVADLDDIPAVTDDQRLADQRIRDHLAGG